MLQALDLDRVVHEPARMVILSVLAAAEEVEFTFLQAVTGLTKGNLSRHISRLEEAGYVEIRKYHKGKIPATAYRMTPAGRAAFTTYWERLKEVQEHIQASSA